MVVCPHFLSLTHQSFPQPNVNRSPRQIAATREAQAAVWRRACGFVGLCKSLRKGPTEPAFLLLTPGGQLLYDWQSERPPGRHCDYQYQSANNSKRVH